MMPERFFIFCCISLCEWTEFGFMKLYPQLIIIGCLALGLAACDSPKDKAAEEAAKKVQEATVPPVFPVAPPTPPPQAP